MSKFYALPMLFLFQLAAREGYSTTAVSLAYTIPKSLSHDLLVYSSLSSPFWYDYGAIMPKCA